MENAHEPIVDQETFNKIQEMKGHIKTHFKWSRWCDIILIIIVVLMPNIPKRVRKYHAEVFEE